MSVLSILVFITQGAFIRRSYSKKPPDCETLLELISRVLAEQEECPEKLSAALERGIRLVWEDAYDLVNPFGDRRGGAFSSVWTFDLDKDAIFLEKENQIRVAPLQIGRQRPLTLDDFKLLDLPQPPLEQPTLPGPYWEPKFDQRPREKSFLGRVIRDFAYTWRHVLRRQMNATTFMKLAYATLWISSMDFTIRERTGFEHITEGGAYVWLVDLPNWETPKATLFKAGSTWFVLAQDIQDGLEMVRRHAQGHSLLIDPAANVVTYAILSLRQLTLCKAERNEIVWTKSEALFGEAPASDDAIDVMLWATNTSGDTESKPTRLNLLPTEIQDGILYHATASLVASAKLGCELGLGSPFSWADRGAKIRVEERKRHRFESSPVESQIFFDGAMSGLSYKRDPRHQIIRPGQHPLPVGLREQFVPGAGTL
ncbi:uncharacterized protein NECHADRAFT_76041 [Fusarium vanettenii 77-13-4]|uniref:Heterokaryon incompatibility domain-containing protein n=1 Tax=Fusarium vanettenii (strain ATCC MYA-4622 / CBS 123669 / FGSC 9596 / NRRL 45880 / 77-13-4) TaxID=660122 RepID=C7Z6B2_FUSV7|nr:uncharacterized protein NECHADRAFT_76041 [Fusarium vanettenii 77-13-4]EEU40665.1 predicted protein [Fusarium vanettenii 77-13-4]